MSHQVTVDLIISSEELLRFYRGEAGIVHCVARDGRRVQFPAELLRPFVLRTGVSGTFLINFDDQGKFQQIRKIGT